MGQGALHRRAHGDARGPAAGHDRLVSRGRGDAEVAREPAAAEAPLSTMRQNRVLDLYIGNLIAGTSIEPVKEWLEGLVTAVRESLPPESPGRIC